MALEAGIVGLPNAGKTTLFNALTKAGAEISLEMGGPKPQATMTPTMVTTAPATVTWNTSRAGVAPSSDLLHAATVISSGIIQNARFMHTLLASLSKRHVILSIW